MKRLFFLMLMAAAYSASAQNNYIGKNDPEATAILKKVSAKYKSFQTLTADILLTVENGQGQKTSSHSGKLYLKGNKYYIQMGDDASFSDGANIYNYDKDAKEIQVTRYNPDDKLITPQKLFTDFYKRDFLYKLNETSAGGAATQEIELTPVDKSQVYFKVLLDVDKSSKAITGAKIFEKNGNKYTYSIKAQKPNAAVPDSRFVFDAKAYPGVEVIDLR